MKEFDMKSRLLLSSFLLILLPTVLLAQGGFRKISVATNGQVYSDTTTWDATRNYVQNANLRDAGINWTQQNQDSVTSRVKTATLTTRGIVFRPPLARVTLDSAAALSDTLIVIYTNTTGATVTLDSITVKTKLDNEVATFRKAAYTGSGFAAIGALTVSSDGTAPWHYGTLSSFSSATLAAGNMLLYRRPGASGASTHITVFGN